MIPASIIGTETVSPAYSSSITIPSDCEYVVAFVRKTSALATPAVSLGGSAFPLIVGRDNTDSRYASAHAMVPPATGAVTLAISAASGTYVVTVVYLKAVDLTNPVAGTDSAGGSLASSFSRSIATASGVLVLDGIAVQASGTITVGADQTLLSDALLGTTMTGVSAEVASGTTTAMQWSTSASGRQAHVLVGINGLALVTTRRPTFLRAVRRLAQRYLPSRVWTGAMKVESAPIPPGLEPLEGEDIIDIVRLKRHRTYTKGGK